MKKKVLFITTANLTTNPRLLKALKVAADQYIVDFIGFRLGDWSDKNDEKLLTQLNVRNTYYLSAIRKPFLPWLMGAFAENICRLLYLFYKNNLLLNTFASNRRSYWLFSFFRRWKSPAYDLVIAHNSGALSPAYLYASATNTPFAFDVEDYHPGEIIFRDAKHEAERRKWLLLKLLPYTSYFTYASPLIGEYTLALSTSQPNTPHFLVNNSFSESEFMLHQPNTIARKVRFVWFSQKILPGRGLELIIPALRAYKDKIKLHLIGFMDEDYYIQYILGNEDFIEFSSALPQEELNKSLGTYDVGLALELASVDTNKNIALSNKLFSYCQAGLYVLATDTVAQKNFLDENDWAGAYTKANIESLQVLIRYIIQNIYEIRLDKTNRFHKAKKLSWENESSKLTSTWSKLFLEEEANKKMTTTADNIHMF